MKRETVGKVATDLLVKQPETTSPIEQMRESLTDYEKNVIECVERYKKSFYGDFYVVVLTKNERLLTNVFRNYFFARTSCPTPEWDQTVYKYKRKDDSLVFMWTVPSKDACEYLLRNANDVVESEQLLLRYVVAFNDGTLLRLAKELNNEKKESVELQGFTWKGS